MTRAGCNGRRQWLFPRDANHGAAWHVGSNLEFRANYTGTVLHYFQSHTVIRRHRHSNSLTIVGDAQQKSLLGDDQENVYEGGMPVPSGIGERLLCDAIDVTCVGFVEREF